jgi:hypothetical protein
MTSLGYSSLSSANQILQPNIAGGANPSGANFTNPGPQFSSIVGGVTGCGGAGGSAAALAGKPGYNIEATQSGGGYHPHHPSHRRGGYKKRGQSNKRGQSKKRCKCRGSCHCRKSKKRCTCRGKCHCKRSNKRTMRGGMAALSPASFSGGANAPYHQFMGGQAASYNFGIGSRAPLPLDLIGTAPNHMMDIHNNCGSNYGMVSKGLIL